MWEDEQAIVDAVVPYGGKLYTFRSPAMAAHTSLIRAWSRPSGGKQETRGPPRDILCFLIILF